MQTLFLIRGLPGSGKSTLARSFAGVIHLETDMFFMKDGEYEFDREKLTEAHAWCLAETERLLDEGESVAVSNTFTRLWEMQPYIDAAFTRQLRVNVIRCYGEFGSIHDVPKETLERMRERFEDFPGEFTTHSPFVKKAVDTLV